MDATCRDPAMNRPTQVQPGLGRKVRTNGGPTARGQRQCPGTKLATPGVAEAPHSSQRPGIFCKPIAPSGLRSELSPCCSCGPDHTGTCFSPEGAGNKTREGPEEKQPSSCETLSTHAATANRKLAASPAAAGSAAGGCEGGPGCISLPV